MIYWINKFVWSLSNPMTLGLALLVLALIFRRRFRKLSVLCVLFVICGFCVLSTGCGYKMIGWTLEHEFPQLNPQDCPTADAIVCLGGGVQKATRNMTDYPDLSSSADRVYMSALLWKAGKAPVVVTSCHGVTNADDVVLRDLGVRPDAIVSECDATTTEENAKFIQRLLDKQAKVEVEQRKVSVLLVTSAWHMKRSLYMFKKYAPDIECIPVACDFEVMTKDPPFSFRSFVPDPAAFELSCRFLHEWLGIAGYHFRR